MKKTTRRLVPALTALLGALAGFALRCWQMRQGVDITGRLLSGHPSGIVLAVFCAAVTAALALMCRKLEPRTTYTETFSSGLPEMLVSAAAALLLVFSAALSLMSDRGGVQTVIHVLGLVAGLCFSLTAALRFRGVVPSVVIHMLPCVYFAARLIVIFKRWSLDPVVQDYCYSLFASIASMCASYHFGGFCLNQGRRRLASFWCLAGTVFAAVALVSGGTAQRLFYGAVLLWCAVNGWQLLED